MRCLFVMLLLAGPTLDAQSWRNIATQANRADYAIHPVGDFHGDETKVADGTDWLALRCAEQCFLLPSRASVAATFDALIDAEDEETGRKVRARGIDDATFLLRGAALRTGAVESAVVQEITGFNGDEEAPVVTDLVMKQKKLTLRRIVETGGGEVARVRLLVEQDGHSQLLAESDSPDLVGYVLWSGDLDGDGEIDLIVDLSDHYNISLPTLLLSSEAVGSDLLGAAAVHLSSGC